MTNERLVSRCGVLVVATVLAACGGGDDLRKREPGDGASNNGTASSNNGTASSNNGTASSNNGTTNVGSNNGGTCDGCFSGGECVGGALPDACGQGGGACEVCPDGYVCSDGACHEPLSCGPQTCNGCCDSSGQCRTGDSDAVCGAAGGFCDACEGGESCSAGMCQKPCAETCDGCCDGEVCLAGDVASTCGSGGGACVDCGTNTCDAGQCIAPDCATNCAGCCDGDVCLGGGDAQACGASGDACVGCGSGQTCVTGTCVVDPTSTWNLVLLSGALPAMRPSGTDGWDFDSEMDPFVFVQLTDATTQMTYAADSSVVTDDSTPDWNDEVVIASAPAEAFRDVVIEVYDYDEFLDDLICYAEFDFNGDPIAYNRLFSGSRVTWSCVNTAGGSSVGEVVVRLDAAP